MPFHFSQKEIKEKLTLANYISWFKRTIPESEMSCGSHNWWVFEELGIPRPEYSHYKIVKHNDIHELLKKLDQGYLLSFYHNYKNPLIFNRLSEDNRYGNHEFIILKAGNSYYVTQGFLYAYKHSIIAYNFQEIKKMLEDIIDKLSDYENKKVWGDIDLSLYKKYFRTPLFLYPKKPVKKQGKMHNIILSVEAF